MRATSPRVCRTCPAPLDGAGVGTRYCPPCGAVRKRANHQAKKKRRAAIKAAAWKYEQPCPSCGKAFVPVHSLQLRCSKACTNAHGTAYDCRRCGQFLRIRTQRRRVPGASQSHYCDPCRDTIQQQREYRKRGAKVGQTPYRRADIAERDSWRCHICKKKCDKTRAVPHPKAATIDHLIPIARGGVDSAENVALAHFSCNTKRNVNGEVQLLLVG